LFFGPFDDLMTEPLTRRFLRRGYSLMRHSLIAPRRRVPVPAPSVNP
jgi:hypothetical protein